MENQTQEESKKESMGKTYSVHFEIPKVAQHSFIQCEVQ